MHLDEQVHKHGHEERAREDMAADNVERKVGEQDQRQPLRHGEPVGDLRVHLGVLVVRDVDAREQRHAVEGEVRGEEEEVVDDNGRQEFER